MKHRLNTDKKFQVARHDSIFKKSVFHLCQSVANEKKSARSRKRAGGRNEIGQLNFFLFLRGERLGGGLRLGGALLEFIHATGGVHELLRAGVERMAHVANADDDGLLGGARLDHVAAGATDFRVNIFWMNVRLHKKDGKTIMA